MKRIRIIALVLALCFLTLPVYAGDGGGDNSDSPITLNSCTPADGTEDLAPDAAITMEFNKNVVNNSVKENNMACFTVTDSSGSPVEIVVEMGDDQVDRDARRIITVRPADKWPEGEKLTLTVSGELTAKNGTVMGTPITLTFRTAGGASGSPAIPIIAAVCAVAVLAAVFVVWRKRKTKSAENS